MKHPRFPTRVYTRTLSRKGQFTIPLAVRRYLGVGPGDRVSLEVRGENFWVRRQGSIAQEPAGSLARSVRKRKEARTG